MSTRTFAAIDVGSFELTMKIFEFSGKNNMRELDCITQHIDLGSDTYATGKISQEKMDELCRTLKEFKQIMESYQVEGYRAYGTSAVRLGKEERRQFYFGNLDPYRMVANREFQENFTIQKQQLRADPYDNQSGEMETTDRGFYYHEYERNMDILCCEEL